MPKKKAQPVEPVETKDKTTVIPESKGKKGISLKEEKVFLPFQLELISSQSLCILVEKSRQIGLSWSMAYLAVKYARGEAHFSGRGHVYFATKTKHLAKQFIEDCKYWIQLQSIVDKINAYEDDITVKDAEGKEEEVHTYNIKLPNGVEIIALSSNADAMRGWRGFKIIDEFAFHPQQSSMLDAILPSRMWRKPFIICSTHKGRYSEYNKLITKFKKGQLGEDWQLISIPIQRAIEDGLLEKVYQRSFSDEEKTQWLKQKEKEEGTRRWNQEYCCIPDDEEGALLSYQLIEKCASDETLYQSLDQIKNWFYVGFDVGRVKNPSMIWVAEKVEKRLYTRFVITLKNTEYSAQRAELYKFLRHPKCYRAGLDATGIGNQLAEDAQKEFGAFKVEKVMFTNERKNVMASQIMKLMEDRDFIIPQDDTIAADFHSIEKELTDSNNIRLKVTKNADDQDAHADRFWAAALAVNQSWEDDVTPFVIGSALKSKARDILYGFE